MQLSLKILFSSVISETLELIINFSIENDILTNILKISKVIKCLADWMRLGQTTTA